MIETCLIRTILVYILLLWVILLCITAFLFFSPLPKKHTPINKTKTGSGKWWLL